MLTLANTWLYLVDIDYTIYTLSLSQIRCSAFVLADASLKHHSSVRTNECNRQFVLTVYQIMYLFYHTFQQKSRSVFRRGMILCSVLSFGIKKIFYSMEDSRAKAYINSTIFWNYLRFDVILLLLSSSNNFRFSSSRVRFL